MDGPSELPLIVAHLKLRAAGLWGLVVFRPCFDVILACGSTDDCRKIDSCLGTLRSLVDPTAPRVVSPDSVCPAIARSASFCEAVSGSPGSVGRAGWALYHYFTHLDLLAAGLDGPTFPATEPVWAGFARALRLGVKLTASDESLATQQAIELATVLLAATGERNDSDVLGDPISNELLKRVTDFDLNRVNRAVSQS